ncbi:MAG: Holliday junction branch migration protein RuvA [Candidatus Cloacimonetes bacterium]|nr:Holliday junction branch migration protein RuvA [Candidatus Cloacimonadota bacterium]
MAGEIKIPVSTYEVLPVVNSDYSLYTYLSISQDDVRIYGFATEAERMLFQILTKISGIGPKIAISVLSTLTVSAFVKSVRSGEEAMLTRVPGIGKKSAQRMIVELKDRIHTLMDYVGDVEHIDSALTEVENALLALGFNTALIQRELKLMTEEDKALPTEQLIKEVIKRLYQRAK